MTLSSRRERAVVAGALLSLLAIVAWPTTEAAALACGDVITEDTTLEHDLLDCPGDGLVIGADNVTLRLNGFMIDGTRTPAPQRLASTRSIRELVDDMRALQQRPNLVFGVRNEGNDHGNVIGPGVIREFDLGVGIGGLGGFRQERGRISNVTLLSCQTGISIGDSSFRFLVDNNNLIDTGISGGADRGAGIGQISIIRNFVRSVLFTDTDATTQVVANSVAGGGIVMHRDVGSVVNNNNVFHGGISIDGFDDVIVSNNTTSRISLSGDALEGGILRNTSVYLNVVQNASVGVYIRPIFIQEDNTVEANRLVMKDDQILQEDEAAGFIVRNNFCDPPDDDPPCSTDFDPGEVVDSDVDSVLDRDDECPGTDFQPAVVINGIDTNIANMLIGRSGCTMMDRIHQAAVAAEDRSDFIGAVALLTRTWLDEEFSANLIDEQDAGVIRRAASGNPLF